MESSYLNDGIGSGGSGLGYAPLVILALLAAAVWAYGYLSKSTRRNIAGWMKAGGGLLIILSLILIAIDVLRLIAR